MLVRILAVGDVVGREGLRCLARHLRTIIKASEADFVVVNGENAAGLGITPDQAEEILDAGAHAITLGNHSFARPQILHYLDESPFILRPANFAERLPGRGSAVLDGPRGLRIGLISLMGRLNVTPHLSSPFEKADRILDRMEADLILVDFHAEATSEKGALAYYLDGRVSAVWGTHTHVPTADGQLLPKGSGFITDVGMTGPCHSVLGIPPEQSINLFTGGIPERFTVAEGPCKVNAVLFTIDSETGRCTAVQRYDYTD